MAEDNHISSHLHHSTSQETQIQQQQMDLPQIQQQHIEHAQIQQNQMQQVHIQQLPIQQQPQIQQQSQFQQPQFQQQQPQIQQMPVQQSQQQVQAQEAANSNISGNSTVQQNSQINASPSVQFNVATVNASQTQQIQTFPQNVNTSSGASVQLASPQILPQIHSIQGGSMISQASASYPTVSMAQSPVQQNIVNSGALTATGQVVGTVAKANFPPTIMPAPSKAIIQSRPGFAASNQAIIGTAFISQSQSLHPAYSSVPVNSSAQMYNTSQVKQINSQPQILHMPGTVLNQAQLITLPHGLQSLPGLTWGPIPGNFQSPSYPIIFPGQQPHVVIQSPQNTVQMPSSAVQAAMPATTFAVTPSLPSRIRPRVRPGIQTVAVATQTMASNAVTLNPNAPSIRTQKPKNKISLSSISSGYLQPTTHQVVTAQTLPNQSLPQLHPSSVLQSDTVPKHVIFPKTKPVSTQSKSVEADTSQFSQQTTTESKDMASYTEVQSVAPISISSTISTVTASSIIKETVLNPFISTALMPSTSVNTSSVVTTATSIVPIITSSTSTVSVTPVVTSSVVQENALKNTSSIIQENKISDTSSIKESKNVNILPPVKNNSSVHVPHIKKENALVTPITLCSETLTTTTSPSDTLLDNVDIDDSDIVSSILEPEASKETIFNNNQTAGFEKTPEKPLSQPVSPVKEKPRQRAIVKPQVLTHVIDGFVIQEGPEPFPVRQSSLQSGLSNGIKQSAESKESKDDTNLSPDKKVKSGKPRGRPRKRRMSTKRTKDEQVQLQNPSETVDNAMEEAKIRKLENEIVHNKTPEKNQEPVIAEKAPAEESIQMKESTEEKHEEVEKKENDITEKLPQKWSVEEVFEFIRSMPGCEESAHEFKAQEIDGQALMLLETDHIIKFMSMKVGPALKLISQIDSMKKQQLNT